jgi:hypothetical protein
MWQEYYEPQLSARNRYAVAGPDVAEARRASAEARAARRTRADRTAPRRAWLALAGGTVAAAVAATAVACLPVRYDTSPSAPAPAQIAPAAPQLPPLPPVAGSSAAE